MTTLLDSPARISVSPHVLNAIRDEECNLTIWERTAEPALRALLEASPKDVRFDAPLSDFEARLKNWPKPAIPILTSAAL